MVSGNEKRMGNRAHLIEEASCADVGIPNETSSLKSERNGKISYLEVPCGVSCLTFSKNGVGKFSRKVPAGNSKYFCIEALYFKNRIQLLIMNYQGNRIRINGQSAPCIVILNEGDQLDFDNGVLYHLSSFNETVIGPAPEKWLGKECGLCRIPFKKESRTYICWFCSTPLHMEDKGGLECAALTSDCLKCGNSVRLVNGYSYLPESMNNV